MLPLFLAFLPFALASVDSAPVESPAIRPAQTTDQPSTQAPALPLAPVVQAEHWIGTIYMPMAACPQVTFIASFRKAADAANWTGVLSITPGCAVRGMLEVALQEIVYTSEKIQFVTPAPPAENLYDLTFEPDKQSARGKLLLNRQQGMTIRMRRATADEARDAAPRRPQRPVGPLPYEARPVSFVNSSDGVMLNGIVTVPRESRAAGTDTPAAHPAGPAPASSPKRRLPAVVLLGDENPLDMDQSEGFHKPGLVLADQLTRCGIIVLRFDDRGVGQSGGMMADQTMPEAASDAKAAAALLARLPEVDPARIGFIGRGEGATIAAMAATENKDIGFVVLMAPAAIPWKDALLLRERRVLEAQGEDAEFIKARIDRYAKLLELAADGTKHGELHAGLRADALARGKAERMGGATNDMLADDHANSQMEYFVATRVKSRLSFDPKPVLEKLCCPVLALAGELDMHTPPKDTMPGVEAALKVCAGSKASARTFVKTNHWFQPCNTGFEDEFDQIDLTISPEVLSTMCDWINALQTNR